jgi:hypothetical protein
MTEEKKKDKGERIRGRELKIAETELFKSMPFLMRLRAWLFGGVFGIRDPESKLPRIAVVYIPSVWLRFYYKHLYKHKVQKGESKGE